ncbi:MAG: GNAT family N-acetyltransferase [Rikenellaceae bacterium]
MIDFDIKEATLLDVALINSLAKETFSATYSPILSPDQVEYMFEMMYSFENIEKQMASGHNYFIAYLDSVPCGYVSIRKKDENYFYIEKIYTIPKVHGSGVGKELFEFACNYATLSSKNEKALLELNVNRYNARAISFYKKMGMHPDRQTDEHVGNGYYANDYVMAIEL